MCNTNRSYWTMVTLIGRVSSAEVCMKSVLELPDEILQFYSVLMGSCVYMYIM